MSPAASTMPFELWPLSKNMSMLWPSRSRMQYPPTAPARGGCLAGALRWARCSAFRQRGCNEAVMRMLIASRGDKLMKTHTVPSPAVPSVLEDPIQDRGTAFTPAQREALGLTGRLPSAVQTLDQQAERAYRQLRLQPTDLA